MLKLLWIAVLVVVADQISKLAAVKYLTAHATEVMPFFNLKLVFNSGAAFGLFSDAGGWQNFLFAIIALIVSVVVIVMARRLDTRDTQMAIGLMLVLGGALGNFFDRLRLQSVVDFFDVYFKSSPSFDIPILELVYCHLANSRGDWHAYANEAFHCHWPVFNVADSAISIGAVLLVLDALGVGFRKRHSSQTTL
ncbi:MAG: signal peptidase II [Acidiferrobacterales bacterium]